MANIKSAEKRISTTERRNKENRFVRATLSTKIKNLRKLISEGKVEEAEKFSKEVFAYIDSACSKGVIHKNAASRKVGRLAAAMYKAKSTAAPVVEEKKEEVKAAPAKTEATKAPAKKTTTTAKKTTTTKKAESTEAKPAAKKTTTAKKTATKKAE